MAGNSRQSGAKKRRATGGQRREQQSRARRRDDEASQYSKSARGRRPEGRHRGRGKTENDLPDVSMLSQFASLVCPYCGEPIRDITGAIAHRETGEPAHFECVLKLLEESEPHEENETIIYIGRGNFAVAIFEGNSVKRKFKIVRVIEWEGKNSAPEWRAGVLNYYKEAKPAF